MFQVNPLPLAEDSLETSSLIFPEKKKKKKNSEKIYENIFMNIVCCNRDRRFKCKKS